MKIEAIERHHFLLRRLHSLSGVVPIGMFLMVHLVTNSSIVWGALNTRVGAEDAVGRGVETFQHEVNFINNLPLLLLIELFGLWVPIAFHSILGVYYATSGKANYTRYAYQDNWRYTLQRWSGYLGVLFIFYHVATLRWGWAFLVPGGTEWSHYFASSTLSAALKGSATGWTFGGVIVSLFYFTGVSMLVFHFANGLWTAAITWGITVSANAQKRWGGVCAGLGVALMGAAWAALFGFLFLAPPEKAFNLERGMNEEKIIEEYGPERGFEYIEKYREKFGIGDGQAMLPADAQADE